MPVNVEKQPTTITQFITMVQDSAEASRKAIRLAEQNLSYMQGVSDRLSNIDSRVDSVVASSAWIEQIAKTQRELQAEHIEQHVVDPMVRSAFALLDSLGNCTKDATTNTDETRRVLKKWAVHMHEQVLNWLRTLGVDPIITRRGDPFDSKNMVPMASLPTPAGARPEIVTRMLRIGFRRGDRVLRHCAVEIYTHGKRDAATDQTQPLVAISPSRPQPAEIND